MALNWDEYTDVILDIKALAAAKNKDYGTESLLAFGAQGCMIRLYDKVNRLKVLTQSNTRPEVKDESIEDTCMDIVNYAIYTIMMKRNKLIK